MATNFPTSLDALTNPTATDKVDVVSHADQHANANDAIEALETKVGVDSSAVTTSHDYKLSGVADGDKTASLTGSETFTNKTLTSPILNTPTVNGGTIDDSTLTGDIGVDFGSDATGDIYYRDASGNLTRLGIGTDGQILQLASGLPSWASGATGTVSVETTTGATHSLTTTGTETVVVWAKGDLDPGSGSFTVTLAYDGVAKDTITVDDGGGSFPPRHAFALMYTETPTSGTRDITVTTSGGTLANVKIIVQKIT